MPRARGTTLQPRVQVTRSSVPPQAYAQLSSGTNSSYSYDSDGMRLRTFEGSVWSTMVWDQGDYLAVNRSGADDSLFVLMDGEVLGEILGSEARDYLADPLGSVCGGFDSSQDLQDAMSYWPYGEPLPSSRTWGTLFWLGTLGYYQDPGSRVYVRARSYSTNTASWLQVDPLWPVTRAFSYVRGNPGNYADPMGMRPQRWKPKPVDYPSWITPPSPPGAGSPPWWKQPPFSGPMPVPDPRTFPGGPGEPSCYVKLCYRWQNGLQHRFVCGKSPKSTCSLGSYMNRFGDHDLWDKGGCLEFGGECVTVSTNCAEAEALCQAVRKERGNGFDVWNDYILSGPGSMLCWGFADRLICESCNAYGGTRKIECQRRLGCPLSGTAPTRGPYTPCPSPQIEIGESKKCNTSSVVA